MEKQKILIVDDSEMNRALLADILEGQYDVTEAEDGAQAVEILAENEDDFWFVLLDIMMPKMDGFAVLNYINKQYWNDRVVVMMISSDDSPENINRAYSLGAFDYIGRPFDPMIVRKRIANTLFLYARQHDLEKTVKQQFYEQQKNNDLMISILSHIVEFRNGESGLHIQHVKIITELLLRQLIWCTDKYELSEAEISLISMASAIHDVGKISIPAEILNKPGKLTPEEFEQMKTHAEIGSEMLTDLPVEQFYSPLVKVAYQICRWHHERYDGRGYPDGLKGEEIPISAQVVSLADVYDALTSERCYKKAFSHEKALSMILEGDCGAFNPILLECLKEISDRLKKWYEKMDDGEEAESAGGRKDKTETEASVQNKKQDTPLNQTGYMRLLYVDPLTGTYNHRYYKEHIKELAKIDAAVLIDVNHLKRINDVYGQAAGDLVLQGMAQTLLSLIGKTGCVIHYGGDKFLIVFNSMVRDAFEEKIGRIRQSLDTLSVEEYPQLYVTINMSGVYGNGKPEELFSVVDNMLKQSKNMKKQGSISYLDWDAKRSAQRKEEEREA